MALIVGRRQFESQKGPRKYWMAVNTVREIQEYRGYKGKWEGSGYLYSPDLA